MKGLEGHGDSRGKRVPATLALQSRHKAPHWDKMNMKSAFFSQEKTRRHKKSAHGGVSDGVAKSAGAGA